MDVDREQLEADASEWKERGNALFSQQDYGQAVTAYQAGINMLAEGGDEESSVLSLHLRLNLALALLRLGDHTRAERECTFVIDRDPTNSKAYYRRGMAREGLGRKSKLSKDQQLKHIIRGIDDLQESLRILNQQNKGKGTTKESQKMKSGCQAALDRLESRYEALDTQQRNPPHKQTKYQSPPQKVNGSHMEGVDSPSKTASPMQVVPDEVSHSQKQDVMRLLMARQVAGGMPKGEAFFLVNWNWWCQWCRRVDFFYNATTTSSTKMDHKTSERVQTVLKLLPPGAVVTEFDDDSDDSSEEGDTLTQQSPLGAIDNSHLLLDNSIFHQQWYGAEEGKITLRPNLVRGCHYELLPREVYNALRSWYGEVTPSLCRRTAEGGAVPIYVPTPALDVMASQSNGSSNHLQRDRYQFPRCSACRAPGAVSRCKRCMSVQYCDRDCQEAHWPFHKVVCKQLSASGKNGNLNLLESDDGSLDGRVGLNNLGNTCFMNSALHCLSHAAPLTRHFLSNKYRTDVNTANPLGTGGKLVLSYDAVLKELWMRSSKATSSTSHSPTALKRAIALFAPRFAGCLQHDAQEFLAYLLDGLHEDLNRIRKAPYVEMPDVTDGHNMAIAGAKAWDAHKRRNDSLVLDTFYGQFQSTCVCPKCNRVSVSFEAFNHVSLEIPQFHKMTVTIPVIVLRQPTTSKDSSSNKASRVPYRYGITLRRQCVVADLKTQLSELTGITPDRLFLGDVYESSLYELLPDKRPIAKVRPNDVVAAFEVDGYSDTAIHAVATHFLVKVNSEGEESRSVFGFPFMTCFSVDASCKQVWENLWAHVRHLVVQTGARKGYVDSRNRYRPKDILTVKVVNNRGQPVEMFTDSNGEATADLPTKSSESIGKILGKKCTQNFLLLSFDWRNPHNEDDDEDMTYDEADHVVRTQSFLATQDHSSWIEAAAQQRGKKNGSKAVTLDQCLETFTKPEQLDENNKWYCSKCKEHVRAMKTMKLWRLPNVLVVHLKRFEFKHALRRDKLDTFVEFPLEGLDMGTRCASVVEDANDQVPAMYDLFGVVNHFGRMGFGHYTAFCRQFDEKGLKQDWALFDDSNVRPASRDDVVTPAAYVLFYRRRQFN